MAEPQFETVPVGRLRPHPDNPRKGDVDAIAASIRKNGFYGALVVQRGTNVVLAGNHRLQAAIQAGMESVPVVYADVDDEGARRILLADNRTSDLAGYDPAALLDALTKVGDLDGTGFASSDVDRLLAELNPPEAPSEEDGPVGALPKAPQTKPGDVWLCGPHRLVCGDSTDPSAVEAACGGRSADMLLTDPPYGVDYTGKTKKALKIRNDAHTEAVTADLWARATDAALGSLRPGAYLYATGPSGPVAAALMAPWLERGLLRQMLVWAKDTMVLGHSEYHYKHELILFGWVDGGGRHKVSDRTRTSVWEFPKPSASRLHPTMKPVAMWMRAIRDGSVAGETVLDVFGGSGTTLLAAHRLGRRAAVVELDPAYCDVALERWRHETGRDPVLEGG